MASSNTCFAKDDETELDELILSYPPKKLLITVSQNCNLACKHCPRQRTPKLSGEMSKDLLGKVLTEVFPHLDYVRVGGADLGEAMTYSGFDYLMEQARDAKAFIELQTNGVLIDEGNVELIVACCDRVSVSAEGTEGTYERVRGVSYDNFKEAIKLLVESRKQINPGMKIEVVVAVMMDAFASLEGLFNISGVDAVTFRYFEPVFNKDRVNSPFSNMAESDKWIDHYTSLSEELGVSFSHPGKFSVGDGSKRQPCPMPWETVHIDFDGTVYSCCEDIWMGELCLNDDLMDVWNNKSYQRLRKKLNSLKPPLACRNCYVTTHPSVRAASYNRRLSYTVLFHQLNKILYAVGGEGLSKKMKKKMV